MCLLNRILEMDIDYSNNEAVEGREPELLGVYIERILGVQFNKA